MEWQVALIAIGKGLLSGAGSKLFTSLFGTKEPEYVSLILSALQDMAQDLKRNFKEELDRIELDRAKAALVSAVRKARQYNISPKSRKDTLDEITVDITNVITNLEQLGPSALGSYMISVGLEIAIIQERARVINKKELFIAVCDTLVSSRKHISDMINYYRSWNESRFTRIISKEYIDRKGEPSFTVLSYTFENRRFSKTISFSDTGLPSEFNKNKEFREQRHKHIEEEWNKFYNSGLNHIVHSQKTFEQWANSTGISCASNYPKGAE